MGETFLQGIDLVKRYGNTVAVNGVSLAVAKGEILGLIGSNGAGKSTLTRLVSGVARPDEGRVLIDGVEQGRSSYDVAAASDLGIKVVYQELSLFSNLSVYENFYIEQPRRLDGLSWRSKAWKKAEQALAEIFPDCSIRPDALIESLSIAQRQMVEIARAASDDSLRLLILDEPTSSMGSAETAQFLHRLPELAKRGIGIIYISHRLDEVTRLADNILILQNGAMKWSGPGKGVDKNDLIRRMSEVGDGPGLPVLPESAPARRPAVAGSGRISLRGFNSRRLRNITVELEGGKIYGLAGLEGNGQKELLRVLFSGKGKDGAEATLNREGRIAFVSGDRKKEGVFPLWDLLDNMRIGKIARAFSLGGLTGADDRREAGVWYDRLQVKAEGLGAEIGSLSGGNQQKILIARAMLDQADIILLDDPTRGVDVGTKRMLYDLFREAAGQGKLLVWHSTEDDEFAVCDEVLVMRYGHIVKRLDRENLGKDAVIAAAFSGEELKGESKAEAAGGTWKGGVLLPLATMLLVYVLSGIMTPGVFTLFGLDLLAGGAVPLALAAVSQMYIIGFSHINMGVGALMGLVNVLGATWLSRHTGLGLAGILGVCLLFTASGLLIRLRNIPAIVVTLGSSFIWTGISYTIQSHPGGQAPEWLVDLYNTSLPFLPTSLYWLALLILAAWLISTSRYGTVLKAAGNNPLALKRSGWSILKATGVGYFISGLFCALGGLALTAITTASDANSSASYTLLTVAAVVMGGGELTGGKVSPAGAVFGAVTLSLIGSLLGFMKVSSNYVTLVQGLILIAILGLRLLRRGNRHELV